MKTKEYNFRRLERQFALFTDKKMLSTLASTFNKPTKANAFVGYGYIDHDAGFTFEYVCFAGFVGDCVDIYKREPLNISFKIRYENLENSKCILLPDNSDFEWFFSTCDFSLYYELEESTFTFRSLEELDPLRAPGYPDDILVYILQDGLTPEGIWARFKCINSNGSFEAELLNKPFQPFSIPNNTITVYISQSNDKYICISAL